VFQCPWEPWPDTSKIYAGPVFPKPLKAEFSLDEARDFRASVLDWYDRSDGKGGEVTEDQLVESGGICDELWEAYQREKTMYWLMKSTPAGTVIRPSTGDEGDQNPTIVTIAFSVDVERIRKANDKRVKRTGVPGGSASQGKTNDSSTSSSASLTLNFPGPSRRR
jgi:hypothetical protein